MKNQKKMSVQQVSAAICVLFFVAGISGCGKKTDPKDLAAQQTLPVPWQVFDLLVKDLDGDGRKDIVTVDHGENLAQLFYQQSPRAFEVGPVYKGVGFHPGEMIDWAADQPLVVMGAEGSGAIRALKPDEDEGFASVSEMQARSPRQVRRFDWPGWGPSLAVSPYSNGVLYLLRGYDPEKGTAQQILDVRLSEKANTIREAQRVTPVDIDGDGVTELLFVVPITGEVLAVKKPENEGEVPSVQSLFKKESWGLPNEVHALDIDADQDFDLLVPDETAPSQINVLINDGSGHFKLGYPIPFPGERGIYELRVGRDHDGQTLLFAAGPDRIALYRLPVVWDGKSPLPEKVDERTEDSVRSIGWDDDVAWDMDLTDVDGDGWLDGVLGRIAGERNVWVVYGPLWDRFTALSATGFELKKEVNAQHDGQQKKESDGDRSGARGPRHPKRRPAGSQ